ncbi:MAG: lysoplasmalogenase [Roseiflexaceae bacterium]
MPDIPTTRPRRAVYALYSLAAALLLLGRALGRPDPRRRNGIPLPLRMLSSALVLACALLLRRSAGPRQDRAARLVAGGMGCGFVGDLVMARIIPLPKHVIFGMLAFGAGHVLYMRAFLDRARAMAAGETATAGRAATAVGVGWALGLAGWWALARNPALGKTLNYSALAYSLLLSSMSGLAASLAARDRRYTPLAIGGALFLASDTLLASELFRKTHFTGIGDVVWLAYITGQALIVGTIGLEEI